jgi:alpha-methylacyl-CoA racemase
MMLADMGARVIRVDRRGAAPDPASVLNRSRESITVDLKQPEGVAIVLRLVERADALIEGFRPGVTERLGLGPDVCLARNPRLVYGRMTGWGQDGPLANNAGHDIDYIALSGALAAIGKPDEPPTVPLNLIGDFGGGGMLLAFGITCALLEARQSGHGQVVDAAMTDGAAILMAMMYGMKAAGLWQTRRSANLLDGGAPYYACYACADGKHIAVGALEPQFYAELMRKCGVETPALMVQGDVAQWPEQRQALAAIFRTRTRAEWQAIFEGTNACVAPVLDMDEAPEHAQNRARNTFVEVNGVVHPAPAPRFSRTPPDTPAAPVDPGAHTELILREMGYTERQIADLHTQSIV